MQVRVAWRARVATTRLRLADTNQMVLHSIVDAISRKNTKKRSTFKIYFHQMQKSHIHAHTRKCVRQVILFQFFKYFYH